MHAAYITETGSPEKIIYGELPAPECTPKQVLVRVRKVAVNPIDTYIRNGANFWPLKFPFIIGCDFAGEILEVGSEVDLTVFPGLVPGQRVWGSNQGLLGRQGTFAEVIAVDPEWVYHTPDDVSDAAAVACALVGITAQLGLFEHAKLTSGEKIFVRGGSGGVGSMVVQMAKASGAEVITTAGSPEKASRCKELGADQVIEYNQNDTEAALQKFAPEGVDVFWETLRVPDFDLAVGRMAENGRMVVMAGRDARPEFPVGPFYVKGCSIFGFAMFKAAARTQRACAERINELLLNGKLVPQIDRTIPLALAAEAHRLQQGSTVEQNGTLAGKVVLEV